MLQYNFIKQEMRSDSIADVKVDASFRRVAKNAICFHIWKIDEERLEGEPKAQYGTFVDDGAYIIYAAGPPNTFVNQDTITREVKPGTHLERFIHFWLGEKVSEQNRSNIAHKIQELDSYFDNVATQYRETQGNESARFLSYFKRSIVILTSELFGITNVNRLYQIYGRKCLRCIEMDSISWNHFNSGYVMLLKTESNIFIWIGRSTSSAERRNAIDWAHKSITTAINITIIEDGYEQSMPEKFKDEWNSFLPLSQRAVAQTSASYEKPSSDNFKIYKCSYKGTRLHLDQIDVDIPQKDDLNDITTAFVLDGFMQGVWLWVGSLAPHGDKISAMGNGRAFVKKKKYPYCTPVIRVIQGHEPVEFMRLFPSWQPDPVECLNNGLKTSSTTFSGFDALTLSQRPKLAADAQLIDDGTGERKIYRITKDQVLELRPTKITTFHTSYCYIVKYYVVMPSNNAADSQNIGINTIIYQWNGSDANSNDVISCEKFALSGFEKFSPKVMFVQMSECDETPHFLQIFDGKLIILRGDKNLHHHYNNKNNLGNNINYAQEESESEAMPLSNRECYVLKIFGDTSYNSKAVEVFPLTTLNGKDCYVVKTKLLWVWCGQSSTGDSREMAKKIGTLFGECSLVVEGREPAEFWHSITSCMTQPYISNGNSPNNNSKTNSRSIMVNGNYSSSNGSSPLQCSYLSCIPQKLRLPAQLFLVWLQQDKFYSQEIIGYEQKDLSPECIYVLDTGVISYIWLGKHATSYEKEKFMKIAQSYLESVPIVRRPSTAIAIIRQDDEPNTFKGVFDSWDHALWSDYMSYEKKRQSFNKANGNGDENGNAIDIGDISDKLINSVVRNSEKDFDRHHKYPISTLQQEVDLLPAEVNPLQREMHLTHDDFVSLFNMSFWEFDALPTWKRKELKKKYKLF